MDKVIIAIDGFASTGKSTLAKKLSQHLGLPYVDSGALFRGITFWVLKNGWVSDDNLNEFDYKKIKEDSVIGMRKLLKENKFFDFIYIDGSHNGEDVLSDAIEAFKILRVDGILFFDDFLQYDKFRTFQSYEGIEKFLSLYSDFLVIKYFQSNLIIKKKNDRRDGRVVEGARLESV